MFRLDAARPVIRGAPISQRTTHIRDISAVFSEFVANGGQMTTYCEAKLESGGLASRGEKSRANICVYRRRSRAKSDWRWRVMLRLIEAHRDSVSVRIRRTVRTDCTMHNQPEVEIQRRCHRDSGIGPKSESWRGERHSSGN